VLAHMVFSILRGISVLSPSYCMEKFTTVGKLLILVTLEAYRGFNRGSHQTVLS